MKLIHLVCSLVGGMLSVVPASAHTGWYQQNPLPTANSLYAVSMIDANTATAVGANGTILRTTNGGTTWSSQVSGTTAPLFAVCFTDVNRGTAVGGTNYYVGGGSAIYASSDRYLAEKSTAEDSSVILRTSDGGINWVRQSGGATSALFDVCLIDANIGTAVGESGTILRTTDGGDHVGTADEGGYAEPPRCLLR